MVILLYCSLQVRSREKRDGANARKNSWISGQNPENDRGGRAVTVEGAMRVLFKDIAALNKRLDQLGMQTLNDIPGGGEIDPHWRGKIEP